MNRSWVLVKSVPRNYSSVAASARSHRKSAIEFIERNQSFGVRSETQSKVVFTFHRSFRFSGTLSFAQSPQAYKEDSFVFPIRFLPRLWKWQKHQWALCYILVAGNNNLITKELLQDVQRFWEKVVEGIDKHTPKLNLQNLDLKYPYGVNPYEQKKPGCKIAVFDTFSKAKKNNPTKLVLVKVCPDSFILTGLLLHEAVE